MGMETLQSAARAAGFAMATSEDCEEERSPREVERTQWRPTEAVLLPLAEPQQPGKFADAMKAVLGFFGRGAPASPA